MTDHLARWLGKQLSIDAAAAEAAADGDSGAWSVGEKWNVYRAEDETPHDDAETNRLVIYGNVHPQSEHIAEWDPARVLREIEMKRSLVAAYADALTVGPDVSGGYTRPIREAFARQARNFLIVLAMPYSDRPGFAEAIATVE